MGSKILIIAEKPTAGAKIAQHLSNYLNTGYEERQLYQNEYISYPRTSSTRLPKHIDFKRRIEEMSKQIEWIDVDDFLDSVPDKLLVDETEKHAGIYPIRVPSSTLPPDYLITWELIARKFFTALAKPAKRKKTRVLIKVYRNGTEFGETEVEFWEYSYLGWMKYDNEYHSSEFIPKIKEGEDVKVKLSIDTENFHGGYAGHLSISKKIGRIERIDVGELLRWMEWVKLGTEATRVEHIAELRKQGLVSEDGKVDVDRAYEELGNIPLGRLTTGEYALLTVASILNKHDAEQTDVISLRDHCWGDITLSSLLRYMKPYIDFLNEELRKRGFVRVSKFTWRKFVVTVDERKLKELSKRLQLDNDESYVLAVAYKLLK